MSSKVPFFPPWFDELMRIVAVLLVGGGVYLVVLILYATSPRATMVGYQPVQPVPYSHAMHVGKLGLDCRYCHSTVEKAAFAAVPPTQTCMNCHAALRTTAPALAPIRASYATGKPMEWVQVHDLADFVYFNHSAHVDRGVGCVTCHGRVDQEERIMQVEFLSMGWCLRCHRNPARYIRPRDQVTNMSYKPEPDQATVGAEEVKTHAINPPTDCWACHR